MFCCVSGDGPIQLRTFQEYFSSLSQNQNYQFSEKFKVFGNGILFRSLVFSSDGIMQYLFLDFHQT